MVTKSKAAKDKGKAPAAKKPSGPLVYVGPNMGGDLPMTQFSVFRGLPAYVEARVKADPDFARLFVPKKNLSRARQELKVKGAVLNKAFLAVAKRR